MKLPTVIVTSVIRSTKKGDSHGGVHLVDLAQGTHRMVIDWEDPDIDWSGRGGDRGLRGIAFWRDEVYLAASDEVFVYSPTFQRLRSVTSPYLRHCHEIDVAGDHLYLSSCGYDSVLVYDLHRRRFVDGYTIRNPVAQRSVDRLVRGITRGRRGRGPRLRPSFRRFDPECGDGPVAGDRSHLNSVTGRDQAVFVAGTELASLYRITDGRIEVHARVPTGTHNARPWRDGLLYNDTVRDRVCHQPALGARGRCFPVAAYDDAELRNADLAAGNARPGFGRGLTVWQERYLITGCSPATVTVHDLDGGHVVRQVNLSMDVRNAVHGLEIWPFPVG